MSSTVAIEIRAAGLPDVDAITEIYNEAILTTTATFDVEPKTKADRLVWFQSHAEAPDSRRARRRPGCRLGVAQPLFRPQRLRRHGRNVVLRQIRIPGPGRRPQTQSGDDRRSPPPALPHAAGPRGRGERASLHLNASFGFTHVGTLKQVGRKFGQTVGRASLAALFWTECGPQESVQTGDRHPESGWCVALPALKACYSQGTTYEFRSRYEVRDDMCMRMTIGDRVAARRSRQRPL